MKPTFPVAEWADGDAGTGGEIHVRPVLDDPACVSEGPVDPHARTLLRLKARIHGENLSVGGICRQILGLFLRHGRYESTQLSVSPLSAQSASARPAEPLRRRAACWRRQRRWNGLSNRLESARTSDKRLNDSPGGGEAGADDRGHRQMGLSGEVVGDHPPDLCDGDVH